MKHYIIHKLSDDGSGTISSSIVTLTHSKQQAHEIFHNIIDEVKESIDQLDFEIMAETETCFSVGEMEYGSSFIEFNITEYDDGIDNDNRLLAIGIIDIFEEVLEDYNIYLPDDDRKNLETEACIFGANYGYLEDVITAYLDESGV